MLDILIVDDEKNICEAIAGVMEDAGYAVRCCLNSTEALAAIQQGRPSLALVDVWLQDSPLDGLGLVEAIKKFDSTIPIIVISGHGGIDTAVAAIERGAYDFIEKPFQSKHLLHLAARATESERLRSENELLRERGGHVEELIGTSPLVNQLRATIKRVANSGSRVLITGAAGTGKEVAARAIHRWSGRAEGPFHVASAAHLNPETIEKQLFGVETGGAIRPGLLERAHGGTLFFDEIAAMPLATQGKILRALTEQSFCRLGGSTPVKSDVRIISSSAQDLQSAIESKQFREDLYYRLNVVPIHIAPLKERYDDIAALCDHFVTRFANERRIPPPRFSSEALAALQSYGWPGNVRELCNTIERILILAPSTRLQQIEIDMLPSAVLRDGNLSDIRSESMTNAPLKEAREAFEREYLRIQIRRFGGNVSRTAQFVGMERSALHRKLKSLGLTSSSE